METTTISINDLISPTYNPRQISKEEMQKLENSITEFGLVSPIVINLKNNHIIGGNQRFNTLLSINQKKGDFYKELTLIKLGDIGLAFIDEDLTVESEDHEKALNLALNKISGEWDFEKLTELLDELDLNGFDISLSGFDGLDDLDFDLDEDYNPDEDEYEIEEDEYEEPDDLEVTVKYGDIYQLGNHRLMCGDSTSKKDMDKLINKNNIDMILTDPPYGMGLDTDYSVMKTNPEFIKEKKTDVSGKKYKQGLVDSFDEQFIKNILELDVKETFLWGADYYTEHIPDLKEGSWIVWDKRLTEDADKMFGSCFELCWSKNKHKRDIARIKWAGIFGIEQEFDHKRHHPTQKPIKLNVWFIERYSKENDNVLDVFGGSGSTLIACEQLNRNCYMMELDPYYCQVIINRWEEFTGEKAEKNSKMSVNDCCDLNI